MSDLSWATFRRHFLERENMHFDSEGRFGKLGFSGSSLTISIYHCLEIYWKQRFLLFGSKIWRQESRILRAGKIKAKMVRYRKLYAFQGSPNFFKNLDVNVNFKRLYSTQIYKGKKKTCVLHSNVWRLSLRNMHAACIRATKKRIGARYDSMSGENIKALDKATVCNTKFTSQFVDCVKYQPRAYGQNGQGSSLI